MYVSAALHLVGLNPDNTETTFMVGQTLKVYVRNYEVIGGIDEVTGKLDSIITSTNEIRLDTSTTMASKYTVIPFGLITNIEEVKEETEESGTDAATFDNDAKAILTVTIPALLKQILNELPDCKCKYTTTEETKDDDGTRDSTEVKDNTSTSDTDTKTDGGETSTDTGEGTETTDPDTTKDDTSTDTGDTSGTTSGDSTSSGTTEETPTSGNETTDTSGTDSASTDMSSSDTGSEDTGSTETGTTLDLSEGDDGSVDTVTTTSVKNGNKTLVTNSDGTTTTRYTIGM